MNKKLKIHLEHLTRVEGHGNIVLDAKNGKLVSVQWQVPEAPRFFEAMMVGRHHSEMSHIASRICGICSTSHSLASLKAVENAMGIRISEQTLLLRKLAVNAENLQSHILHIGYLIAPDLFGVGSVFKLLDSRKDAVVKIVRLHRLANEITTIVCGRAPHPCTLVPGGFTKIPTEKELTGIQARIKEAVGTTSDIADIVLGNADKLPDFERETEYIALSSDEGYALYDGSIRSSDTGKHKIEDYLSIVNEYVVPHSTAKYARHNRGSYMVGALARFNINSAKLMPFGKEVAKMAGLKAPCHNPFMNNIAQLIEFAHSIENSIDNIDTILNNGLKEETPDFEHKGGSGVGAVEAPRGILFHEYSFDGNGRCTNANCVIPTNQNHGNIQKDMEAFAPMLMKKKKSDIEFSLEMLVRAYDPCISCSTHYLRVQFV